MKNFLRIILFLPALIVGCDTGDRSISQNKLLPENRHILDSLLDQSKLLIENASYDSAESLLNRIEHLAIKSRDTLTLSSLSNNLGFISRQRGDYGLAREYYEFAFELDKSLKDSSRMASRLKNIGICYRQEGKYQTAIRYLLRSLSIAEKKGNTTEIASVNNSIGAVFNTLNNFEEAYNRFFRSYESWKLLGNNRRAAIALGNSGNGLLGLGRTEEAIENYEIALELKREIGNKKSISITLNNLGEAHFQLELFSQARNYFEESLSLKNEVNDLKGITTVSNNMAALEMSVKNFRKAQEWLDRSKKIIDKIGVFDTHLENLGLQKNLYAMLGNYKKVFQVDTLYDKMKQTAFNEEIVEVQRQQFEYDLDKEEQEKIVTQNKLDLSLAREETQRIQSQNQTMAIMAALLLAVIIGYFAYNLRKKNRHIENLMRELHHRVKNHLGMISGMFDAQSQDVAGSDSDMLEEARARVEAVNGIHRRLFRQDEYEFVNMQEYLTELVDNSALVFGVLGSLETQLEIGNEPLEIDKAISVGLIANEVLTNAFKYGLQKTEKPVLKIVLEKAVKGYRMLIYNNAAPETEPLTESTGFGSELIKRLTDNLKGESHTTEQNGFHFELTFP